MLTFHLFLERHEDVVGLRVDDVATVDDLLAALYEACCQRDAVMELVEARLTTLLVVGEVGCQVVIEVALFQNFAVGGQRLVKEYFLIGGDDGVDLGDGYAVGILAVDDADESRGVLM